MNTPPLTRYLPDVSPLAFGCMGLGGGWNRDPISAEHRQQAHAAVDAALAAGINFFDHADIYTLGKAEQVFGEVLRERPGLRDDIYIQSKCGIRFAEGDLPGRYDFSRQWILHSVDGILRRLGIDYLDSLLLHRPDPLMEPEEVAGAFASLREAGKVRFFGVSNMQLYQIRFLQAALAEPLVANQISVSLAELDWLEEGVMVGDPAGKDLNFTAGTLQYCRLHGIQIQSWGSLAQGLYSGRDVSDREDRIQDTARWVEILAGRYGVSREAIVLGWLMRPPVAIQPVIGTLNPARIRACGEAPGVRLSRDDWYTLYVVARGQPLP